MLLKIVNFGPRAWFSDKTSPYIIFQLKHNYVHHISIRNLMKILHQGQLLLGDSYYYKCAQID